MPDPGYLKKQMREAGCKLALVTSAEEQDPWKTEQALIKYNDLSKQCRQHLPLWFKRFKDGTELDEDDEKAEDQRCRQLHDRGW